jgi:hypothetical protein
MPTSALVTVCSITVAPRSPWPALAGERGFEDYHTAWSRQAVCSGAPAALAGDCISGGRELRSETAVFSGVVPAAGHGVGLIWGGLSRVGVVDRARGCGRVGGWWVGRDAGLVVGVASLMMRGLGPQGSGFAAGVRF